MISKERLEAEAEFYAKYGNVEKTVKMPVPPTWEEFIGKYGLVLSEDVIYIESYRNLGFGQLIKIGELTKENYYKALDKMVERWKEEV